MRSLLLIRHGQASFRAADYDRLSDLGVEQSRRLGSWFAECGVEPDVVIIGPRQRHLHTAQACLSAANLDRSFVTLDGLDEVDHQELLARLRPDFTNPETLRAELKQAPDPQRAFQTIFATAIERWVSGKHDSDYTTTWAQFRDKVLRALDVLAGYDAETIWAFTSGGPIAVIANTLLAAPIAQTFTLSWSLVNTSITRLRLGKHGPRLVTYNAWPHLERSEDRALITLR